MESSWITKLLPRPPESPAPMNPTPPRTKRSVVRRASDVRTPAGDTKTSDVKRASDVKKPAGDTKTSDVKRASDVKKPAGDTKTSDVRKPAGDAKTSDVRRASDVKKPASDTKTSDVKRASDVRKPAGDTKSSDVRRASQVKKPASDTKTSDVRRASDVRKPAADRKTNDARRISVVRKPAGDTKTSDVRRASQVKKPASDTKTSDFRRASQVKKPAGDTKTSDVRRPAGDTKTSDVRRASQLKKPASDTKTSDVRRTRDVKKPDGDTKQSDVRRASQVKKPAGDTKTSDKRTSGGAGAERRSRLPVPQPPQISKSRKNVNKQPAASQAKPSVKPSRESCGPTVDSESGTDSIGHGHSKHHRETWPFTRKDLSAMYKAYIPEHRDYRKNMAMIEAKKLCSTTYGVTYLRPLKEVARKKTDNVKFSTSPPRRPRGVSPLLGRKQKEQKKYHEVPVYHAEVDGNTAYLEPYLRQQRRKEYSDARRISAMRKISSEIYPIKKKSSTSVKRTTPKANKSKKQATDMDLLDALQLHNAPEKDTDLKVPSYINKMRSGQGKYRPQPTRFQCQLLDIGSSSARSRSLPRSECRSNSTEGHRPKSLTIGEAALNQSPTADTEYAGTEMLTMSDYSTTADDLPNDDLQSEDSTDASPPVVKVETRPRPANRTRHPKPSSKSNDSTSDDESRSSTTLPSLSDHSSEKRRSLTPQKIVRPSSTKVSDTHMALSSSKLSGPKDNLPTLSKTAIESSPVSLTSAATACASKLDVPDGCSSGDHDAINAKKSHDDASTPPTRQTRELSNSSKSGDHTDKMAANCKKTVTAVMFVDVKQDGPHKVHSVSDKEFVLPPVHKNQCSVVESHQTDLQSSSVVFVDPDPAIETKHNTLLVETGSEELKKHENLDKLSLASGDRDTAKPNGVSKEVPSKSAVDSCLKTKKTVNANNNNFNSNRKENSRTEVIKAQQTVREKVLGHRGKGKASEYERLKGQDVCATVMVSRTDVQNKSQVIQRNSRQKPNQNGISKRNMVFSKKRNSFQLQGSDILLKKSLSSNHLLDQIGNTIGKTAPKSYRVDPARRTQVLNTIARDRKSVKAPVLHELHRNTQKVLEETYGVKITKDLYARSRHRPNKATEDRYLTRRNAIPKVHARIEPQQLEKFVLQTMDQSRGWTDVTNDMVKTIWHKEYHQRTDVPCVPTQQRKTQYSPFFEELDTEIHPVVTQSEKGKDLFFGLPRLRKKKPLSSPTADEKEHHSPSAASKENTIPKLPETETDSSADQPETYSYYARDIIYGYTVLRTEERKKEKHTIVKHTMAEPSFQPRKEGDIEEQVVRVTDSLVWSEKGPKERARAAEPESDGEILKVTNSAVWKPDDGETQDEMESDPAAMRQTGGGGVHYPKTSQKDRQSHRSVKFSHTMVIGGGGGGLHKDIVDLSDTNEPDDENVVNVTTPRSRSSGGSASNSPRHSAEDPVRNDRKYSIDTPNDLIGFGMSSFLSTRDSLEVASKKNSKSACKADSEIALREHLSKLVAEINSGKLGPLEMRKLNNFAQKLINAHQAGEVIGKPTQGESPRYDVELIYDGTPSTELRGSSQGSKRVPVSDTINNLMGDIRSHRLTSVQLADLALSIADASSRSAEELKLKLGALGGDETKATRDAMMNSIQGTLRSIGQHDSQPRSKLAGEPESGTSSRVKWHEEPESQLLIRHLHKLKGQMILAPSGGSFVESIEKVIKDVDEDVADNFLYDAMILSLCLIVTYQEWQNSQGEEGAFWKKHNQNRARSRFDVLASEIIVAMFQKTTNGLSQEESSMEDLIRLTTLVSCCDSLSPHAGNMNLAEKETSQHSFLSKDQEDVVLQALTLMKRLFATEKVKICDLFVMAKAAYKLQTKSLGNLQSTHSIWSVRKSSSRLIDNWSLTPTHEQEEVSNAVELSFIQILRMKLAGLKESFDSIEILQATLQITDTALNVLALKPHLTDFWAASLVLVVALVFERIKAEYYAVALDYKVLDLLINNLVYEAFNVALKSLQNKEIEIDVFQLLTNTITKYREQSTATSVFGVSPRPIIGNRDQSAQAVSSPYAIMDFLEKSLQVMKNSPPAQAVEIKTLGDFALSLQHFYGKESMADKELGVVSPVTSDAQRTSPHRWSGASAEPNSPRLSPTQVVTPKIILEHLDAAIDNVRQQDTGAKDLLSIGCFVTYLMVIPEKLSRQETPDIPKGPCTIQGYEKRLVELRHITHYIPKFDFIMKNLEKTLHDLKNEVISSYNYDLILLSMCIFIAYEWIRTEPLSVFSVTKLDDRAANVIYEAMQSTLRGIKQGALALEDLQNLTSIITNTSDLRRASAVNVSTRDNRRKSSVMPGPPPRVLINDTMVLEFIDELVINDGNSTNLNVEKLNKILTAMQSGAVSSYLYELLVLSICVAASRKALVLTDDCIATQETLNSMPKPDQKMHEFAVKTIKKTIDGLRSGCVHEDEVRNLTNFIVKQTKESIVKPQQLKTATTRLTTRGAELASLLMGISGVSSEESAAAGGNQSHAISKILDFFVNVGSMASELGCSLTDLSPRTHSHDEGRAVRIMEPDEPPPSSILKRGSSKTPSTTVSPTKVSHKTHLLQELSKEAISKLTAYINNGYFTDDQLRNLSGILDQVTSYHDQYNSDFDDPSKVETILDQVLNTTKIIVNNPVNAEKILRSQDYSGSLLVPGRRGGSSVDNSTAMAEVVARSPVSPRQQEMAKDRQEIKNALWIVITALDKGQVTKDEMDMLSHALGRSFEDHEPAAEPVRELELHAMMGKRPLHVSSDFLGETLAAISVKPDGFKRYSYKNLINPDLSRVEGVCGTPEKAMPRRLSLLSEQNVMSTVMNPMDDKERTRRRSSIPSKDILGLIPGLKDVSESEAEEEEDMWEASLHVLKVTESAHNEALLAEQKANKNNSSCPEEFHPQAVTPAPLEKIPESPGKIAAPANSPRQPDVSQDSEEVENFIKPKEEITSPPPCSSAEPTAEQLNNNANILAESLPIVITESEVTKSQPSVGCDKKQSAELAKYSHVTGDSCELDLRVRHRAEGSECAGITTTVSQHITTPIVLDKKGDNSSVSESSMCTMTSGDGDCIIQPTVPSYPPHRVRTVTESQRQTYPKPSRPGAVKAVKKAQPPISKPTSRSITVKPAARAAAEQTRRKQTVAELAHTYVKMMTRPTARSKSKGKTPTAPTKKPSTVKVAVQDFSAYLPPKKVQSSKK